MVGPVNVPSGEQHDVSMVSVGIDNILSPPNVIHGIVEFHDVVLIEAFLFEVELVKIHCEINLRRTASAKSGG
jgi:hypothetical protein